MTARLPGRAAARRFARNRPAVVGAAVALLLLAFAWLGPLFFTHPPNVSDFTQSLDPYGAPPGPSAEHLLGTDSIFRDVLARLAYGGRVSLTIAMAATLLATLIGGAVGITAGMTAHTRFGAIDTVLMRIVDVLLALPFLLFVTAIGVALDRASAWTILVVLGLVGWTGTARIMRAKALQLREMDYVTASRALGATGLSITLRHVVPNTASTLLVIGTGSVAHMILAEAVLGYLTVGIQPPTASWGRMLLESESYLGTDLTLLAAPGAAILLSVLAWNRIGDGLRDALDARDADRLSPVRARIPFDFVIVCAWFVLVSLARPDAVAPPAEDHGAEGGPRRGGWLHLATFVNVRTLDPAIAYDEASRAMGDLVFDGLVTFSTDGHVEDELAESHRLSEDGRTYTFTLKRGVRFHDGAELTADDVKRTLERTLHPSTPSPGAHHYRFIAGFDAYRDGTAVELTGVRALDRYTVEIELTEPSASFLPLMTLGFAAPVCPSSGRVVDPKTPPPPCGTGPFRLESFDPESGARFTRHDAYHRTGAPHLDGIEWLVNVRPKTQRYRFEDGELSFIQDLTGSDAALFRASPAWADHVRWTAKQATNALFMNTELAPFDDVHLRRAVYFALDPSVLAKLRADVEPLDRVLPPSIPGPARDQPMRTFDLERALEEMAAAGYPYDPATGTGGYPEVIEYVTVPETFAQRAAEVFQQQLLAVGIHTKLRLVSFSTYLAEVSRRGQTRMGWVGWQADYPDPENFFEPTLTSKAIQGDSSQNYAFFQNAELDAIVDRARRETDYRARMALFQRAEEIVRDEAPWVPTYVARTIELWHPSVHGLGAHPILGPRFAEVWLSDGGTQ